MKKRTLIVIMYSICWEKLSYEVWIQHCKKAFQLHCDSVEVVARRDLFKAATRADDAFKDFLL